MFDFIMWLLNNINCPLHIQGAFMSSHCLGKCLVMNKVSRIMGSQAVSQTRLLQPVTVEKCSQNEPHSHGFACGMASSVRSCQTKQSSLSTSAPISQQTLAAASNIPRLYNTSGNRRSVIRAAYWSHSCSVTASNIVIIK